MSTTGAGAVCRSTCAPENAWPNRIPKLLFFSNARRAYATLINDCIRGDATLFDRADSVEAAWALVDPILNTWAGAAAPPFPNYPAGSDGPRAADDLTGADGRHWRPL